MSVTLQNLVTDVANIANEKLAATMRSKIFLDVKNLAGDAMGKRTGSLGAHLRKVLKQKKIENPSTALHSTVLPITDVHQGLKSQRPSGGELRSMNSIEKAEYDKAVRGHSGPGPSRDAIAATDPAFYRNKIHREVTEDFNSVGPRGPMQHEGNAYIDPIIADPNKAFEFQGRVFHNDKATGDAARTSATDKLPQSTLADQIQERMQAAHRYGRIPEELRVGLHQHADKLKTNHGIQESWIPDNFANLNKDGLSANSAFTESNKLMDSLMPTPGSGRVRPNRDSLMAIQNAMQHLTDKSMNAAALQKQLGRTSSPDLRMLANHLDDSLLHRLSIEDATSALANPSIKADYYNAYIPSGDNYKELKKENLGYMLNMLEAKGLVSKHTPNSEVIKLLERIAPMYQ